MTEVIEAAAECLAAARRVACLTGAGVSTPSGLPDYRSSGTGVWENYDPTRAANIDYFRRDPRPFYAAYRELGRALLTAAPNPAHLAIARLEALGKLSCVATQNIDSLHQAAGSRLVYELHGHLRSCACLECGRRRAFQPYLEALVADGAVPRCETCGGVIKPDIVMFGEVLPLDVLMAASAAMRAADVCLCVGTSLQVYPAAGLPLETLAAGGALIVVNMGPTSLDSEATHTVRGDVAQWLPLLVDRVAARLGVET